MSRKLAIGLLAINLIFWFGNSALYYLKYSSWVVFQPSLQIVVGLGIGTAFYLIKLPWRVEWFNRKLNVTSEVNETVSYIFSAIIQLPILLFNIYPLTKLPTN